MKYNYPYSWTGSFEVHDSWLDFSEIERFKKEIDFFVPSIDEGFEIIKLSDIKPPIRSNGVIGLHKCRTVSLLCAVVNGERLPPIFLEQENKYYKIKHGFHRYHISIIAGLNSIPAIIIKPEPQQGTHADRE